MYTVKAEPHCIGCRQWAFPLDHSLIQTGSWKGWLPFLACVFVNNRLKFLNLNQIVITRVGFTTTTHLDFDPPRQEIVAGGRCHWFLIFRYFCIFVKKSEWVTSDTPRSGDSGSNSEVQVCLVVVNYSPICCTRLVMAFQSTYWGVGIEKAKTSNELLTRFFSVCFVKSPNIMKNFNIGFYQIRSNWIMFSWFFATIFCIFNTLQLRESKNSIEQKIMKTMYICLYFYFHVVRTSVFNFFNWHVTLSKNEINYYSHIFALEQSRFNKCTPIFFYSFMPYYCFRLLIHFIDDSKILIANSTKK